jgi:predicted transcriptional regulator
MGQEIRAPSRWRGLPLVVALLASILWATALFALGVRGIAENETPHENAHLDQLALLQFSLATVGLICAWFAHFVSKEGYRRYAVVGVGLALPLCFTTLTIRLTSELLGRAVSLSSDATRDPTLRVEQALRSVTPSASTHTWRHRMRSGLPGWLAPAVRAPRRWPHRWRTRRRCRRLRRTVETGNLVATPGERHVWT